MLPVIVVQHRYAVFALTVMDNVGFVFGLRGCTCIAILSSVFALDPYPNRVALV